MPQASQIPATDAAYFRPMASSSLSVRQYHVPSTIAGDASLLVTTESALDRARDGEVVLMVTDTDDRPGSGNGA